MNNQPIVIAIDGPAASGKSTVGGALAKRLGFLYLDTGAMYRAITLLAVEGRVPLADGAALGRLAEETEIRIAPPALGDDDDRQYTVSVAGRDITWELRHPAVDGSVSEVSAHPAVRRALREQQRRIGERGRVVMVGRDIGTVVMPDAPLKVYLDASAEERARRRYEELQRRGVATSYEALLAAMRERDRYDSSRPTAPLRPADDAIVVNCDQLSAEQVVEQLVALARRHFPGLGR